MKRFFKNIVMFGIIGLLLGEGVARIFHLTTDIPSRYIDENQIQKYKPNQQGSWVGGSHTWQINDQGWPGEAPKSYDNVITIIGDSFIENFMNPDSCHQASYLKEFLPDLNFFEAARSGVSFIECMEIAKQLDTLHPKKQLIYVHDGDFLESIIQIKRMPDITQYDLDKQKIVPGTLKSPFLKRILYNWKFMYFLYTNYSFNTKSNTPLNDTSTAKVEKKKIEPMNYDRIESLLLNIKNDYDFSNIVLVLRPDLDEGLKTLLDQNGFNYLELKKDVKTSWSFEQDPHWTCMGHQEAAKQIFNYLIK